jgi:predicted transcriptional regulator of viral defense system
MAQYTSSFSTAQTLLQHELYAFSSHTIEDLFDLDKFQTTRLLHRMERDGLITAVERGKYLLLGLTPEKVLSNPLYIGASMISPAYISFWSALHFHGLTEQVPLTIFVATTRRKSQTTFHGTHYKFVTVKPETFFGYRREFVDSLPVLIADEAKAILDSLLLPEYAGGITEAAKALQIAISEKILDLNELIEYAVRLKNGSLASRLGYLLELLHQPTDGLPFSHGPVLLDPHQTERGIFNSRWKIYANISTGELFPQGII